ncbi:hypothetical protein QQX98_001322 [Neonectria punicea]|uniref:Amidase domain-containing protein n=1 Tax=Neonectria punicea TaxID=979145 RepID=A0ABR1HQE8_9HYPO
MADLDLLTATAADLAKALAAGTVTSKDLAIISVPPKDLILSIASSLDDERARSRIRSPLHGVPIVIKVISLQLSFFAIL